MCKTEATLPRNVQRLIAQLRATKLHVQRLMAQLRANKLHVQRLMAQLRANKSMQCIHEQAIRTHPSSLSLHCNLQPHNTPHIFNIRCILFAQ